MATLFLRGRNWVVQICVGSRRRTLNLGPLTRAAARNVSSHVDAVAAAVRTGGALADGTYRWLQTRPDDFYARLAEIGLVQPRSIAKLSELIDGMRADRADWSAATRAQFDSTAADAITFFGAECDVRAITAAHVDAFAAYLASRPKYALVTDRRPPTARKDDAETSVSRGRLAKATRWKRMRIFRAMMRRAMRTGLIASDPTAGHKTANARNEQRQVFVPRAAAWRVIDQLSGEARLHFVLGRFAGLRIPSESQGLTWERVNFSQSLMTIYAPKTEQMRLVPMIPEVERELSAVYAAAEVGAVYVFARRKVIPAVRREVLAAVTRAGLRPWHKLFQNLRASFATECVRKLPAHTAAALLGHSKQVAAESYWMADASDVERAGAALALQSSAEYDGINGNGGTTNSENKRENAEFYAISDSAERASMGDTGLEPSLRAKLRQALH